MTKKFTGIIGIVYQKGNPNEYLLIQNVSTGNISFPAGGRENNETIEQTLEREIRQETGLKHEDYKIVTTNIVYEFVYNKKKTERVGQTARQPVYFLETEKTDLAPEDSDAKILGWFTAKEVLERLTFSEIKELFRKIINPK